jgi:hypothetical protein
VDVLSTAAGSSLRFTGGVRLAKGTALSVGGPLAVLAFQGPVDAAEGTAVSVDLQAEAATFQRPVGRSKDWATPLVAQRR